MIITLTTDGPPRITLEVSSWGKVSTAELSPAQAYALRDAIELAIAAAKTAAHKAYRMEI